MSRFETNICIITTSTQQRDQISESLKNIGYVPYRFHPIPNGPTIGVWASGEFSYYRSLPIPPNRTFDASVPWKLKTALALAAIPHNPKQSKVPSFNEWVRITYPNQSGTLVGWQNKIVKLAPWGVDSNTIAEVAGEPNSGAIGRVNFQYPGEYVRATAQEIIDAFKQEENMSDQTNQTKEPLQGVSSPSGGDIIGYTTIKDGPGYKKGAKLTVRTRFPGRSGWRSSTEEEYREIMFTDEILTDTEWFKPIYKSDESISLIIGSKNDTISITGDGKITVNREGNVVVIGVEDLKTVLNEITRVENTLTSVGPYGLSINDGVQFIRIGCMSDDHCFSPGEIKKVINSYQKLNP